MPLQYHLELDKQNTLKLRQLQKDLPSFCSSFFRGIDQVTASRTKIAYAYDLKVFFQFLLEEKKLRSNVQDFEAKDLDRLSLVDLEEYMEFLKYRTKKKPTKKEKLRKLKF